MSMLNALDRTVVCTDGSGRLVYIGDGWEGLTGLSRIESLGMRLDSLLRSETVDALGRAFAGLVRGESERTTVELTTVAGDGERRTIEVVIHPRRDVDGSTGAMATLSDVTDERQTELALRHSKRLEAVGRLATGIAHEINTPVQFIGDNLRYVSESLGRVTDLLGRYRSLNPDGFHGVPGEWHTDILCAERDADIEFASEELPRAVDGALEGVQRLASIVRAMRAFGRPDGTEAQSLDINDVVRDAMTLARNAMVRAALVDAHYGNVPTVVGRAGELGHALLDILGEAAGAVEAVVRPTGELGSIVVRTMRIDDMAVIIVSGSPTALSHDAPPHADERMHTRRRLGEGTGRALTLAHGIVERHRGTLHVEAAPEGGTSVIVSLPIPPPT